MSQKNVIFVKLSFQSYERTIRSGFTLSLIAAAADLGLVSPTCLRKAFTLKDPKSAKRQSSDAFGICPRKNSSKNVGEITPGLNFINILRTAFTHVDPKCAKKDTQVSSVIWRFWDLRA